MGKRIYLPNDEVLKGEILKEAYESKLAIHPRSTKMYKDLKESYWWPKMKREIAEYVANYAICQQVKVEHQRPARELQFLPISNGNGIISLWILYMGYRKAGKDMMPYR